MKFRSCILSIFAATAFSTLAEAPSPVSQAELDSLERIFNLHEVVITGTRTPKVLKDTPIQTRLISEAELKQIDPTNIQDLLQQELPGIEFSYAMNQQVNMNMAGFSGQDVLVLLDGERLAGETMENTDFSRLNMNGVSHIEIIRGAASALYGSSANGGVINIITKRATKPISANFNVRAADHHEWRAGGELAVKGGKVANVLDVDFHRISSYTVCLDTKDLCDFRTVYGHRTWNVRDRLSFTPFSGLRLTARAGYYFKERLYNPDTPDRYRDFSGGLRGVWKMSETDNLEMTYAYDQYDKSDFIREYGLDVRDYSNVQHTLRALYNHSIGANMLTLGSDFMRDYLDTYQFGPGETHRQYTADAFAQYDHIFNSHWEGIGAVRWDYFSDGRDNQLTAKLNARYTIGALALRGGYSGGFRAPTLKEKYMRYNMADIFDIYGNPDLKAEKSHNFNLSAEYTYANFYFTAGANYNLVNNKISTSGIRYAATGEPYIAYVNISDMHVLGFDAVVRARWRSGISASLSYNFTHEESIGSNITQYCPARPHSLVGRCSWDKAWSRRYRTDLSVSGRFLSQVSYKSMYMYEPFEEKTIVNPAYTLWKVQLVQHIGEHAHVTAAIDNIFNYAPAVYSFNAPVTLGANLQIGFSLDL